MKTKSKALLLMLCAVLLVAASVLGTMAYLTSTDSVNNTFSVGNVKLELDEAKVDDNGDAISPEVRVKENAYKLLPGHVYDKDPTIHVDANSEDCYLFVKVVDEIAAIEYTQTVAEQMAANGWVAVPGVDNVFIYTANGEKVAVSADADIDVFNTFKIKDDVANDELANYAGKTIVVTAYAVQADGFKNFEPAEIWDAAFKD